MTQLSPHFTLEELSITEVRGVDNTPPAAAVAHLTVLAAALEGVRTLLGAPMLINSGFRCPEVNERVGGASNSAHLYGWAADFICPAFGTPLQICEAIAGAPGIHFDQLINEGAKGTSLGWVHFSADPRQRGQVMTAVFSGGRANYTAGLPKTS